MPCHQPPKPTPPAATPETGIRERLERRLFLRQLAEARRRYHVPSRRSPGLPDLSPEPGPAQESAKMTEK